VFYNHFTPETRPASPVAYSSWQTHMALGQMAYERGLYTAAIRNYRVALRTAEEIRLDLDDLITNLLGLALCDCKLGNISEAEKCYKRVLDIEESASGSGSEVLQQNLPIHLNSLAVIYKQIGRTSEAKALLQKALAIINTRNGLDKTEAAIILTNLAQVSCEDDCFSEAQQYITRALTLCGTNGSRRTKLFAEIQIIMAVIASRQSRYDEAKQFVEQAIEVMEVLTGGQHPELADLLEFAADIIQKDGLQVEAASLSDRALAMRRRIQQRDR
jgi:tetratricopeptide (TPR) repeat protein